MRFIIALLCVCMLLPACAGYQSQKPQSTINIAPVMESTPITDGISLKRKVAIGRFTNETRLASSMLNEGSGVKEAMSRAAADIMMAKLTKTDRFILIERQDSLALKQAASVDNIRQYSIPADYIILGSISEFGRNTSGNVGLLDRTKKQSAYAKVTIRIVDTHNGRVIFGEEGSGEAYSETGTVMGMGSHAGYDETLTDKAIDAAISSVIQSVINKLNDNPWRSYLLSKEGDSYFISGGSLQNIKIGDTFKVYQRGKTVKNPQTGTMIELPGTQVAQIKVVSLIPGDPVTELSVCNVVEGSINAESFDNLYISDK